MSDWQLKPEIEEFYDILQNSAGELLICIKARESAPEEPKIVYDGGNHALLYRNSGLSIMLDFIHQAAREPLFKAKSVLMVEFRNNEVVIEYEVPIKIVKKMPISSENMPLLKNKL